jgi:hypothetical protein
MKIKMRRLWLKLLNEKPIHTFMLEKLLLCDKIKRIVSNYIATVGTYGININLSAEYSK